MKEAERKTVTVREVLIKLRPALQTADVDESTIALLDLAVTNARQLVLFLRQSSTDLDPIRGSTLLEKFGPVVPFLVGAVVSGAISGVAGSVTSQAVDGDRFDELELCTEQLDHALGNAATLLFELGQADEGLRSRLVQLNSVLMSTPGTGSDTNTLQRLLQSQSVDSVEYLENILRSGGSVTPEVDDTLRSALGALKQGREDDAALRLNEATTRLLRR